MYWTAFDVVNFDPGKEAGLWSSRGVPDVRSITNSSTELIRFSDNNVQLQKCYTQLDAPHCPYTCWESVICASWTLQREFTFQAIPRGFTGRHVVTWFKRAFAALVPTTRNSNAEEKKRADFLHSLSNYKFFTLRLQKRKLPSSEAKRSFKFYSPAAAVLLVTQSTAAAWDETAFH